MEDNSIISTDEGKSFIIYPEFKLLTEYNLENESLFQFIYSNSLIEGKGLENLINFTIYNYSIFNQNILNPEIFYEIFKNLKKLIILNNKKSIENLPIFYYQTVYKSICYFNKYLVDWDAFYNDTNVNRLEEVLEFLPDLLNKLNHNSQIINSNMNEIQKCIDQILVFYEQLDKFNESYNKVNKQMVKFFLKNISPINSVNSINSINSINSENLINIDNGSCFSLSNIYSNSNSNKTENTSTISLFEKVEKVDKKMNKENVTHEQDYHNKKEIPNKEIKTLKYFEIAKNYQILNNKVKKYNDNHFNIEKFREKFINVNNINERLLHQRLEQISTNLYREVLTYSNKIRENLEFEKLKNDFINDNLKIELIGSLSLNLFSNLLGRTSIDFVFLFKHETLTEINNFNQIINFIKDFNDEFANKNHRFEVENYSNENLNDFFIDALIYSKNNEELFSVRIFLLKEDLKISNDYLEKIFKIEKLQILHIFFQEILISKIGDGVIFSYRSDISLLILAFLEENYKIFNLENKIENNFKNLIFDDEYSEDDIKKRKLKVENLSNYFYEINEENLDKINQISIGELIIDFFRFLIHLLHYIKIKFNKSKTAKSYEYLNEIFGKDYLEDNDYFFNFNFIFEWIDKPQEIFNKEILNRLADLEDIFFKICECYQRIQSYEEITFNIGKSL